MSIFRNFSVSTIAVTAGCLLYSVAAHSGVFFQDGFESGDTSHTQNGASWTGSVSGTVNSVNPKSGSRSFEFLFPGVPDGSDSFSELRFDLGGNYTDLWVAYDMYIPTNYYHRQQSGTANNKGYLYMWSGNYGTPTGPGLGPNNWPLSDGSSEASIYSWGPGLDRHYWGGCPRVIDVNDAGQWFRIVAHYKYATAANNDGIVQIWKIRSDGTQQVVCDITNGAWYVPGAPGFDQGYILGWANSGFDSNTRFYLDNVEFSDTPLLPGVLAPPNPPNVGP